MPALRQRAKNGEEACTGQCCFRHPRRCTAATTQAMAPLAAARPRAHEHAPPAFTPRLPLDGNVTTFPPWVAPSAWQRALDGHARAAAKAGIIMVQLGAAWPPWLHFVVRACAANRAAVDFYFIGPPHAPGLLWSICPNCIHLPLDEASLLERVARLLGLEHGAVTLDSKGRKLCDMKPMWAALFPELRQRHEWIGYTDHDIIFGDLASEVAALDSSDELLTPTAWFPQPLTNGNLLIVRSTPKMVYAFRRSPMWRQALRQQDIYVFDEVMRKCDRPARSPRVQHILSAA